MLGIGSLFFVFFFLGGGAEKRIFIKGPKGRLQYRLVTRDGLAGSAAGMKPACWRHSQRPTTAKVKWA